MTDIDKYNTHETLCKLIHETYIAKNTAYGDSFSHTIAKYGLVAALTRMSDKFGRVEALILGAENRIPDESLKDTLLDLANYSLMTVMELDEKALTCGTCAGKGLVTALNDYGDPEVISCPDCRGTKDKPIPRPVVRREQHDCLICRGTGTVTRTDAAGSREHDDCPECGGKGWVWST